MHRDTGLVEISGSDNVVLGFGAKVALGLPEFFVVPVLHGALEAVILVARTCRAAAAALS